MHPLDDLVARAGSWERLAGAVGLVVLAAGVSVAMTTAAVLMLPTAYFRDDYTPRRDGHLAARLAKNLLGALLVVLGALMALPGVPGQGVLTILLGISLLDIPGKRGVELALARRASVRRVLDALRRRFGRPPFDFGAATPPDARIDK